MVSADRGRRQRGDRDRARHAPDDRVPAPPRPDPPLHRGLPGAADPRHRLHGLLRAPGDQHVARVRARSPQRRSRSSSGAAPRSPRRRAGAVQSIPREQHEAAAALGFGWVGRHRSVILPQAFRRLLPPFVSLLVNIIQNSTLAAVIGGIELLQAGEVADGAADVLPAGRDRRDPRVRDLRLRGAGVLPDLVPADAARRVPREADGGLGGVGGTDQGLHPPSARRGGLGRPVATSGCAPAAALRPRNRRQRSTRLAGRGQLGDRRRGDACAALRAYRTQRGPRDVIPS